MVLTPDKCGYRVSEKESNKLGNRFTAHVCELPTVPWSDYCYLHWDSEEKDVDRVCKLLSSTPKADGVVLRGLDFSGEKMALQDTRLVFADLRGSTLKQADLTGSNLQYATLTGAVLTGADLSGDETKLQNADFKQSSCNEAEFCDAKMNEAVFNQASLESAHFDGANLTYAFFKDTTATDAYFTDAICENTRFVGSDLRDTHFNNSRLSRASFSNSRILEADFRGARTYRTDFRGVAANHNTEFDNKCYYDKVASQNADNTSELDRAIDVYRTNKQIFRENQIPTKVRNYEIQERDARRRLDYREGPGTKWLWLKISQCLFKYSHSVWRPLIWSLVVVIGFAFAFAAANAQWAGVTYYLTCDSGLKEAAETSFVLFTTSLRVFLPGANPEGGDRIGWMIGLESALGALALSIFVATLVQRARY